MRALYDFLLSLFISPLILKRIPGGSSDLDLLGKDVRLGGRLVRSVYVSERNLGAGEMEVVVVAYPPSPERHSTYAEYLLCVRHTKAKLHVEMQLLPLLICGFC